jgi:hypothetical protein
MHLNPPDIEFQARWIFTSRLWDSVARLALCFVLSLPLLFPSSAGAQTRAYPHIGFVYPAGGQQGTTFTVSLGGQTLNGASAVHFSGTGIQARVLGYDRPLTQKEINDLREKLDQLQARRTAAKAQPPGPAFTPDDEKLLAETRVTLATRGNRQANPALAETVTLEVTVAPDAVLGQRELRVKSPAGLSNPVVFCVGALPETSEPVVTGTVGPAPRPNAFAAPRPASAKPRETTVALPATINGQLLPGEVDRFRFNATKGQRLTITTAARALRPYLADAVPGWIQPTLALFDHTGRELTYADDFRFHPDPVLLCEIPADGEYVVEIKDAIYRGREDFVYRVALGELPFVTAVFPLGGRAGKDLNVAASGWNFRRSDLVLDTMGQGRGIFDLALREGAVLSNSVRISMDDRRSATETEPNGTFATAQAVQLPLTIDGRINEPGDVDVFQFEAATPGTIVGEVVARRLNSPLDSVVEVFDDKGRRLAMNDDFEDKAAGLLTHHADSRVEVALPVAGRYFVRVTDAQRHGGSEYGYRLRLGPRDPDFALRIVPSTINVRAGGTVTLTAYAVRRDGLDGEITLGLKDAPRGFQLSGARIPARQDSVRLTLTTPPVPADEPQNLTLVGVAVVDDRKIGHVAVPAEDMMQAFAYHHLVPAQEMKVQVTGRGSTLRVMSRGPVALTLGGTTRIRIAKPVARNAPALTFELVEPPPGISIVRCESRADAVDIVIQCESAMKPGTQGNLILQAFGERPAAKETKGPSRVQRNPLGLVPAIPFDVAAASDPST